MIDNPSRLLVSCLGALFVLGIAPNAMARPTGPRLFCQAYPDAPACAGNIVSCDQCHSSVPAWNAYGAAVAGGLGGVFEDNVIAAMMSVEGEDSDGDGVTNLEEIVLGTSPGNVDDVYETPVASPGDPNPTYDLGSYDIAFAYRRMSITYCGISPTYEEMQALEGAGDASAFLHTALDACLDSDYWKQEALHRLADIRIRPLEAVGTGGEAVIPLADYEWDYRLFAYIMSDGRDMRDLLLADYHIDEGGAQVTGPIVNGDFGEPLNPQYRAGMITTQWFLMIHTMFSELPRTTAAQAYRAYLGQDIALSQGLLPVVGEPLDVDGAGVTEQTCANCHSTLDPLAYAFAYYNGIDGGNTGKFDAGRPSWGTGAISAALMDTALPDIDQHGVTTWAEAAVETTAFRRNLADMLTTQALGEAGPFEHPDVLALADTLVADSFSADAFIHRLVDTDAFGAP